MRLKNVIAAVTMTAMVAACGGGGSSASNNGGGTTGGTQNPAPAPTSTACSLSARQDWASETLQEFYLFPNLLDLNVSKSAYTDLQSYIDALVAPARAQSRDRYFTYVTSIEEEDAYYSSGANAGYGFRLAFQGDDLYITEAFEDAPAFAAGMDRGDIILGIGETSASITDVLTLYYANNLDAALGSGAEGETRYFRIRHPNGSTDVVTATTAEYEISPVSNRYGAKVIEDNGRKYGYINLRNFIMPADPQLRAAFADFKAQGVTELVIDLRYNGGGLISVADLFGDLMGNNHVGSVFEETWFRDDLSQYNETYYFQARVEAIAPTKVAFIGTDGTASASELVMNGMLPYLGNNAALIGSNTYGKPVGQIAIDEPACDDRFRVVALKTVNADGQGDYYTGIGSFFPNTCQAGDDLLHQLGDPEESSVRAALDFLQGKTCPSAPIAKAASRRMELLTPERPTTAQREVPGLY